LRHRLISSLSRLFRKSAQLAPRAEVDPLFPQRFGKLKLLWHIQQSHVLHSRQAQLLHDTKEELWLLEAAAGEARFEGVCYGICACRQCMFRDSKGRRNEWEQY
jgi:hypothetical protein